MDIYLTRRLESQSQKNDPCKSNLISSGIITWDADRSAVRILIVWIDKFRTGQTLQGTVEKVFNKIVKQKAAKSGPKPLGSLHQNISMSDCILPSATGFPLALCPANIDICTSFRYLALSPEHITHPLREEGMMDTLSLQPHFFGSGEMGFLMAPKPTSCNVPILPDKECDAFPAERNVQGSY